MAEKYQIDPDSIFSSSYQIASSATSISQDEMDDLENQFVSLSHIQDPRDSISSFKAQLGQNHFEYIKCPKCGEVCLFKWFFLGRHEHPECGNRWIETPWRFLWEQIQRLFNGFFSFEVRLSSFFAIMFLPFQIVAYLMRTKS